MDNYESISTIACATKAYIENPTDKWRQTEIARMQAVADAVEKIADAVNGIESDEVAQIITEVLGKQHRTLQSKTVESLVRALYRYSGIPSSDVDARNEGARELARDVVQGLESVDPMYEEEPRLMSI